jgi:hypothetical protein
MFPSRHDATILKRSGERLPLPIRRFEASQKTNVSKEARTT